MLVGPKSYLKEFDFYSKESRNVKKKKKTFKQDNDILYILEKFLQIEMMLICDT